MSSAKKLKSLAAMALFLLAAATAGTASADAGFVSSTCQKTKNATQCVSVLDADPGSNEKATTERDLAWIALRLAIDTAGDAAAAAMEELAKAGGLDEALRECSGAYFDAANTLEIDALDSFNGGDFLGASQLVDSCKGAGERCDGSFPAAGLGPAPELMAEVDRNMTQRCAVALDLIGLLFVAPPPPAAA